MAALDTNCSGQRGEAQIEWYQLRLNPAFLLLVCEYLANAIARRIGVVGKPDFIMLVVQTPPQKRSASIAEFARAIRLCSTVWSVGIDAGAVILPSIPDVIERVVVERQQGEKTFVENIGRTDRLPVIVERRIWLPSVESARLCRIRRRRRIRRDQIRVTSAIDSRRFSAEGVRMNRELPLPPSSSTPLSIPW